VEDLQYHDLVGLDPVDHEVWRTDDDQLTGVLYPPGAAKFWMLTESL
jgi:hypothetical protein